jgi:hypothetical protein
VISLLGGSSVLDDIAEGFPNAVRGKVEELEVALERRGVHQLVLLVVVIVREVEVRSVG